MTIMTSTRVLTACAACALLAMFTASIAGQGGSNPAPGLQVIRAPFIVVDGKNQTLMRVDTDPKGGYARVVVGTGASRVEIISRPDDSAVQVFHEKRALTLAADLVSARMRVWNSTAVAVATLQSSQDERGYFSLADEKGNINVDAGTNPASGVGLVRANGPRGGGVNTAPGMPPSYIRGWD
jgi:hypothetical protein